MRLSRGEWNAFWALLADNLANMIIITAVCRGVFGMSGEIVFGRLLPGLGVALILGLGYYAWAARRLARREGRMDVTALPYGISTPVMFVYLFGVMGPIHAASGDPLLTWRVGVAAAFVGGLIEIAGSAIGPTIKRLTPRAGMLGTLAGIALVWIAAVPLARIFSEPLIGFPALIIILVGLVARQRLPFGVPAGLAAVVTGAVIALGTGRAEFDLTGVGLHWPIPVLADLIEGLRVLLSRPDLLALIVPVEIYNFMETMNNVESAEAAGDSYNVRACQVVDGLGTLCGALFGAAFPTTVYIGHPGYKRMGAGAGYALMVGVVLSVSALLGLLGVLRSLVPVAAVAPMLVYVGLVIVAQAFTATPSRHAWAVGIALLPHVSDLLVKKWGALLQAIGSVVQGVPESLSDPALVSAMLAQGAVVGGHSVLSAGAILSGLIWGAAAAALIDRCFRVAAAFFLAAALLTVFGIIHAAHVSVTLHSPLAAGYLLAAIICLGLAALYRGRGGLPGQPATQA